LCYNDRTVEGFLVPGACTGMVEVRWPAISCYRGGGSNGENT